MTRENLASLIRGVLDPRPSPVSVTVEELGFGTIRAHIAARLSPREYSDVRHIVRTEAPAGLAFEISAIVECDDPLLLELARQSVADPDAYAVLVDALLERELIEGDEDPLRTAREWASSLRKTY